MIWSRWIGNVKIAKRILYFWTFPFKCGNDCRLTSFIHTVKQPSRVRYGKCGRPFTKFRVSMEVKWVLRSRFKYRRGTLNEKIDTKSQESSSQPSCYEFLKLYIRFLSSWYVWRIIFWIDLPQLLRQEKSLEHFPDVPQAPPHLAPAGLAQTGQQPHTSFTYWPLSQQVGI